MNLVLIGLDFDGTIVDTNHAKSVWLDRHLGKEIPPYKCDRTSVLPLIGESTYRQMCQEVYSAESTASLEPTPRFDEVIRSLADDHSFFLITARRNEKLESADAWLSSNGYDRFVDIPPVGTLLPNKVDMCKKLGVTILVDDDERHMPTDHSSVLGLLFKPQAPEGLSCSYGRICRSWNDVRKSAVILSRASE